MNNMHLSPVETQAIQLLGSYIDLPAIDGSDDVFAAIRKELIDKLETLLHNDYEKLLWLLYRIDVDEEKAKARLAADSATPPAAVLADLILERLLEKARSRINNPPAAPGDLAG